MQQWTKWFRMVFLVDLIKGLLVTLRYTPQPAFTFQYPAERRPVAPRFRGVLRLQVEPETGAQTCIVCDQCAKVCPDELILLGGRLQSLSLQLLWPVRGGLSDQASEGADYE